MTQDITIGTVVKLTKDNFDSDENNKRRDIPAGTIGEVFAIDNPECIHIRFEGGGWLIFTEKEILEGDGITILPPMKAPKFAGTLNESNIETVAQMLRELLYGKEFTIFAIMYADSENPRYEDQGISKIEKAEWTDGNTDAIRTFHYHCIQYSAGHYLWSLDAAKGDSTDHQDFNFTYIEIFDDSIKFESRAPAGKGYLCKYEYNVIGDEKPFTEIKEEDLKAGQIWMRDRRLRIGVARRLWIVKIIRDSAYLVNFRFWEPAFQKWSPLQSLNIFYFIDTLNDYHAKIIGHREPKKEEEKTPMIKDSKIINQPNGIQFLLENGLTVSLTPDISEALIRMGVSTAQFVNIRVWQRSSLFDVKIKLNGKLRISVRLGACDAIKVLAQIAELDRNPKRKSITLTYIEEEP